MTFDYNSIVGFLGGSLVTLFTKEIFDIISKKREFARDLTKATYLRKLEIAEKAVAYYWTYLGQVVIIKNSFQVIIQAINELDEKNNDIQIIQGVLEKNSKILENLSGESYLNINSVHLYFDLEDTEKWGDQDGELFLKSMAETKSIDNDIQFWTSLYNNYLNENDSHQADFCWSNATNLFPQYVQSLQKIVDILERNRTASHSLIQKIRAQLKRY